MTITQAEIKDLFDYRDGSLFWRKNVSKRIHAGMKAGSQYDYIRIRINRKSYYVHRLVFLYHHGYLPKYIDHIDRDPLNNKIENLRECTQAENIRNAKKHKEKKSSWKGVWWSKQAHKWASGIFYNGKSIHLGYFKNELEAALAYDKASSFYFESFNGNNLLTDNI